jgi:hypothetical protein
MSRKWGQTKGIKNFWLGLKQKGGLPEPYSIRQVFYQYLPEISKFVPMHHKVRYPNWGRNFYQKMTNVLSDLVLENKVTYQELNILNDSGASEYIYQNLPSQPLIPEEEKFVEYPIEVWVENNATFNSVASLFRYPTQKFKINVISQRGFAKSQQIEKYNLKRKNEAQIILTLTDFDPDGWGMPQDLYNRFYRWCVYHGGGLIPQVIRIGVFPDQIPNERKEITLITPNKRSPRYNKWIQKFGLNQPAYELQALTPKELRRLVSNSIETAIKKFNLVKKERL